MVRLPLWTAVIPTYGEVGQSLTANVLRSLQRSTEHNEIIVVDDGSSPDVQEGVDELCDEMDAKFIALPENGGFAKAVNAGIEQANGSVVILVNNDTLQIGKTLDNLANFVSFSGCGIAGCKLLYKDKSVQHGGVHYVPGDPYGYWDHTGRGQPRDANYACRIKPSLVTGAMMAINRHALDMIGLLDERYGMAWEDIDFQMRAMETNLHILYCGIIEAYHFEGRTRGNTPAEKAEHQAWTEGELKSQAFFFERWKGVQFERFQLGARL